MTRTPLASQFSQVEVVAGDRLKAALQTLALVGILALSAGFASGTTLSDPEVDAYNVHVGTQTFAGLYQFTTNSLLVETAEAIQGLGSDVIKIYHGKNYPGQYRIVLPGNVTNLLTLARDEPSCRRVLDMPFRHFVMWAYPFSTSDAAWTYGYTATLRTNDYREIYDLTRYLLTNYNHSRKSFYLGHWEGDWYLLPNYNTATNPTPTALKGMIDWLNNRQKAIDDAKRDTSHSDVDVFGYAEANRVLDAMSGNTNINQRVINKVVPYVTNLDFVSWSSYDGMNLNSAELAGTLNYMQSQLPTNKAGVIQGPRVWIGEYGWGASTSDAQEPLNRGYLQRLFQWGTPRFILFWEIYNNETNRSFWLVDSNNVKVASWHLHQRFINNARLCAARFKETNGRLPTDSEFAQAMAPTLDRPLAPLVNLSLSNGPSATQSATSAKVTGTLAQGIYGADCASVSVFWGRRDGGTSRSAWEQGLELALNTNFNPVVFTAQLTNLAPQTNYYFRFYATNATGEAWAPNAGQVSTTSLNPNDYGSRMKIAFTGYQRGEALANFPTLVRLSPSLPGFSYRQFASPTGGDLRFTDAGGTWVIPHEIEEWNTNGTSSVWVRVPQISGPEDFICAYWGNPLASNSLGWPSSAVWSEGFDLVWHMKESGFPFADSTGHYPGISGVAPGPTVGIAGRAGAFKGSSQYINAGPVNLGDYFTVSAWVKLDLASTNIQTVWANKPGGWDKNGFALYINSFNTRDQRLLLETGNGSTGITAFTVPNVVTAGQWHCITASVDEMAGAARLYVDGTDYTQASAIRSDFTNRAGLNLGRLTDGAFYLNGTLDEVRVESGARSSNWVWASWMTTGTNAPLAAYSSVTQQRPVLSIMSSGASLSLIWPASGVGFILSTATNLVPPIVWTAATNLPILWNGNWQVAVEPDPTSDRFYRLELK